MINNQQLLKQYAHMAKVQGVVDLIKYKEGWTITVRMDVHRGHSVYIQCKVKGTCADTHKPTEWVSGKRYLSEWMCKQELVGAVFALIKDAEMHEVHEWFRYKGRSIYNPHLCPDKLAELCKHRSSFVARPDSMSKA